jgi:hypothetical protein
MGTAGTVIGWLAWAAVACLAVSFVLGCRKYAAAGVGFPYANAIPTFFFSLITIAFLLSDANKLHILWIAPLSFFLATWLGLLTAMPFVGPLIRGATNLFMRVVLIGVKQPERREV